MPHSASVSALDRPLPASSVFVSANAGAGKTSLLTSRVLMLLLSGVEPSRILCLTFTNAAAAEMSSRVLKRLGSWVMMDEDELKKTITEITGIAADKRLLAFARSLFAKVLDAPEGVRIQTIHGFCQSLLRRFPLEAGISPHFSLMDSRSEEEMLHTAKMRLFSQSTANDQQAATALNALAREASEQTMRDVLKEIINNKQEFFSLVRDAARLEDAKYHIWKTLGVEPDVSAEALLTKYFVYDDEQLQKLRHIAALLSEGGDTDKQTASGLARWLEKPERNLQAAQAYCQTYLTKTDQTKRKNIFTAKTLHDEALIEILTSERDRALEFENKCRAIAIATRSCHILTVAHALLSFYEAEKQTHAQMDYDDLILTASRLLTISDISSWVLYKLDGGIDHILVDEAQDTSPAQWHIIRALSEEFFAGKGTREATERTLFIVGDEKQSIYRFQGADVRALKEMQDYFANRIKDSGGRAEVRSLNTSYRSLPAVLQAVDKVCADPALKGNITFNDSPLEHIAHRTGHTGYVEVWPFTGKDDEINYSAKSRLVKHIADTIASWLEAPMWLESKGRPVNAGDIMILVRTRTDLVGKISSALKRRNIPVAGIDRMQLTENLAVQDLIAFGQILLLPEDDLSLACVLKSPICNISEEALFQLAYNRGGRSLWQRLGEEAANSKTLQDAYELIAAFRSKADFIAPFELYTLLLDTHAVRSRITGRMGEEYDDPIDEFLSQALVYERSHVPSLQGFIYWLNNSQSEIKRDMDQARGQVRIMTIHGAKGLQAPIVILPDTAKKPTVLEKMFWNDESLPFWPEHAKAHDTYTNSLKEGEQSEIHAEYCRQLYVALTRAEDMLCIGGATENKKATTDTWYDIVFRSLQAVATPYQTAKGSGLRLGTPVLLKKQSPAPTKPDGASQNIDFSYLNEQLAPPAEYAKPLTPSKFADDEPAGISPLQARKTYSRGQCIHLLLQHLPDIAELKRVHLANQIADRFRATLDDKERTSCINEALGIITHTEFAKVFAQGSMAEVPVTGVVEIAGRPYTVSGQIDRLSVGDDVLIVDYKTGSMPPELPTAYLRQMTLYKLLLSKIYPKKQVHCALLWTSSARMQLIPDALLDESTFDSYI